MAYGDLKVRNLIWNTGSGDNTVVLSTLATQSYVTTNFAPKANPTFTGTINGADLILSGNLTVSGTQTIINTNVLQVEDKHIEIGKVSTPSDTTADGGGIILKASSDRTFVWINSTDAWTSSEHIQVASGKTFIGDGSTLTALNASNLGSGTVATARLGSGTASSSNYLRGDGSWQTIDTDRIAEGNTSVITVDTGSNGHIKLKTEGIERVRIIADGKVGIGTTSPTCPLHIKTQNGSGDEEVKIEAESGYDANLLLDTSNGGGAAAQIFFQVDGTTKGGIEYVNNAASASVNNMIFRTTTNAERLRLGASGQIGIAGANYGTSGQVLTSGGASAAPSWTTISAAPEITATAGEALTAGDGCVINSSGNAEKVKETVTINLSLVSEANVEQNDCRELGSCYNVSTATHVMIVRWGSGYEAKTFVSTYDGVNSSGWSHGSGQQLNSSNSNSMAMATVDGTNYAICGYRQGGNYQIHKGQINASNKSVSWSTLTSNLEGHDGGGHADIISCGNERNAIISSFSGDSYRVKCYITTGSGSMTLGSAGTVSSNTGAFNHTHSCYDSVNDRILCISQRDESNNVGVYSRVGTISGTTGSVTTSWGTINTVATSSSIGSDYKHSVVFDPSIGKFVCVWKSGSNCLGSIGTYSNSGKTEITWGSAVTLDNDMENQKCLGYDDKTDRTLIAYINADGNTPRCKIRVLTISGNNITTSSAVQDSRDNASADHVRNGNFNYDTANKQMVIAHGPGYGRASYTAVNSGSATTNALDFVGFASANVSSGAQATLLVSGNTTSDQSGLTVGKPHYFTSTGGLSTTASDPAVVAGVALSATKLLIKG